MSTPPNPAPDDTLAGFSAIATKFGYLCGALNVPADLAPIPFSAGLRRLFLHELTPDQRRDLLAAATRAFAPPPVPPPEILPPASHATATPSADAAAH